MPDDRRRGRPSIGERVSLGLRVTPELKRKLDAAAETSGRSQSQEAELRLERCFDRQELLPEVLKLAYGKETAGILMMLGFVMGNTGDWVASRFERTTDHWTSNAHAYDQAVQAALTVLDAFGPKGSQRRSDLPSKSRHARWVEVGFVRKKYLFALFNSIRGAAPQRTPSGRNISAPGDVCRSLLGNIAERLTKKSDRELMSHMVARSREKNAIAQPRQAAIEAAADSILSLINSSPRSPSRSELVKVIETQLQGGN